MPDLESLAMEAPESLPAQLGDADDPRPWLDAYDAGVGSPLELKFLRLFETHGVEVEKKVAVGPEVEGPVISQADFLSQVPKCSSMWTEPRSTPAIASDGIARFGRRCAREVQHGRLSSSRPVTFMPQRGRWSEY